MSDPEQASRTPTTSGAIDESRRKTDDIAGTINTAGGPGNAAFSGVTSGDGGPVPQGAHPAGMPQSTPEGTDSLISTATSKIGDVASQAGEKADAGMEKAVSGMDSLAGTLRQKSESMGSGQIQSVATIAADKIESGAELLRGKDTDQLMNELEALVRRKPVESMLVAAGVGFILSKALR